jgi:5,10-methylenetetrahydromethanopterin reductase
MAEIAFQADKPPGQYGELGAAAEAYGFDVVSIFADLLYQPMALSARELGGALAPVLAVQAAGMRPEDQPGSAAGLDSD